MAASYDDIRNVLQHSFVEGWEQAEEVLGSVEIGDMQVPDSLKGFVGEVLAAPSGQATAIVALLHAVVQTIEFAVRKHLEDDRHGLRPTDLIRRTPPPQPGASEPPTP